MKNDYKKNDFYIKKDENGNKYYFMRIYGTYIEVPHEVFNVCYASYKTQLRDIQKDINYKLKSLDNEFNNNVRYVDMVVDEVDHYEQIKINDEVAVILHIIKSLPEDEKDLITNLLLKEKTERELSRELDVPYSTIHKRKNNIIKKIKKQLKR
ncbi:sigma-70 family RNA polymerase sigma factor [Catenibacterium sp. RTP21428st1_D7_RTP21428_210409]|uniref:sigma-70 family RNA polymerase sigma factor n=1 Tax=unclassified Catenibacterium TaxID=2643636 RepID=UPI0032EEE42D